MYTISSASIFFPKKINIIFAFIYFWFVFCTRSLMLNLVLVLIELSFNFCSWYILVYKQEGEPLFIWILIVLNYKFLCSIYTTYKYSHVVNFPLRLLTNNFFTFRAVQVKTLLMWKLNRKSESFLLLFLSFVVEWKTIIIHWAELKHQTYPHAKMTDLWLFKREEK